MARFWKVNRKKKNQARQNLFLLLFPKIFQLQVMLTFCCGSPTTFPVFVKQELSWAGMQDKLLHVTDK